MTEFIRSADRTAFHPDDPGFNQMVDLLRASYKDMRGLELTAPKGQKLIVGR